MIIDGVDYCDQYHSPLCHCRRPGEPSPAGGPSPEPLTEPERQRYIAQAAEMGAEIERLRRTVTGLRRVIAESNERPALAEWRVDL